MDPSSVAGPRATPADEPRHDRGVARRPWLALPGRRDRAHSPRQLVEHPRVSALQDGYGIAPECRSVQPETVANSGARFEDDTTVASGTIAEQSAGAFEVSKVDGVGRQHVS